jgi:ABC-2 type transport system permease protein
MNTMKWLVRREFWEHKGMFFWAPLIAAGLIVLAVLAASFKGSTQLGDVVQVNGHTVTTQVNGLPPAAVEAVGTVLSATYLGAAGPLMLLMTFALFFYLLGAMYDERRDRSILFWKSLPVSDSQTVLSKVASALVLVPLLYIGISIVMAILSLMIGSLALLSHGINIFPVLFSKPSLYTGPLMVIGLLPVYILWALPTVGWLLMVSSWAKSKVFLWAVGVPLMLLAVLNMLNYGFGLAWDLEWFSRNVILRGLGSLVPGIWAGFADMNVALAEGADKVPDFTILFTASWGTLAKPNVWIGAAAGIAMIAVAVRMRRWRDEG